MENDDLCITEGAAPEACGPCRPETTLAVARGAARLMRSMNFSCVMEFPLPSGRRADIAALGPKGEIWIVEVKSSVEDFRTDRKWQDYRAHCDRLFFAVALEFPRQLLPQDTGLMVADPYGAHILRSAPEHRMAPATRKALTLRFARLAAARWHAAFDPTFPVP